MDWEKTDESDIKFLQPLDHKKDKRIPEKKSTSVSLTIPKPLTVWITINCGKFLKEMGISDHFTFLLRNLYAGQEVTIRLNMGQWRVSKLGKEYIKTIYCHPPFLTYIQCTLCKMPGWSWNQDCQEKYQQPQICRWYLFNGRKQRGTKEPLDKAGRGEWKSWLKTQHSKN